jgi:hypothetical protein
MNGCSRDGGRRGAFRSWWLALALALLPLSSSARAADIETRDFTVTVSGKLAGEVHMTIHRKEDGSTLMRCDTDIKVKTLLGEYKYVYRGLEIWKDHRLTKFDSNTDDNGKRYIVSAVAENAGLRLTVNNAPRMVKPHVWLTSYWSLPDPKLRNQELALIDADNGRDLTAKLQFVATEKIKVAGGPEIPLNHYRLSGKVNVDLWYDGSERLVRQEWIEQGHKTIVELRGVRR